jgi:hypothetical protein
MQFTVVYGGQFWLVWFEDCQIANMGLPEVRLSAESSAGRMLANVRR